MFDRIQLVARAVAIVLMFTASGYTLADDADEYRPEVHDDLELADRPTSQRRTVRKSPRGLIPMVIMYP